MLRKAIENWFGRWLLRNPQRTMEGALLLTYVWRGILQPPLEMGSVNEARAWCRMQQWHQMTDEVQLSQYHNGVWVVIAESTSLTTQLEEST